MDGLYSARIAELIQRVMGKWVLRRIKDLDGRMTRRQFAEHLGGEIDRLAFSSDDSLLKVLP